MCSVFGRVTLSLSFLLYLLSSPAAPTNRVRVWQDQMTLPTYREKPPDPFPPFDQFAYRGVGHFYVYPYTVRDNLTGDRYDATWRVVNLENEYLHCRILPDLGGHLYTCRDKLAGVDMFYANSSIKKKDTAPRGAWAALGIETSFPIAHSRLSVSPVQFAATENPDGSATVTVMGIDRVSRMEWRVAYTLRPGVAALEQRVGLYNPNPVRQPYQWWTNAAIRVPDGGLQLVYPMYVTAPHGSGVLETWPVTRAGVDMSKTAHYTADLGLFGYGSREPFFAAYNPVSKTGVVHWADPKEVPGKKMWVYAEGASNYRSILSDDRSGYTEIQAGLLTTQDELEFLQPQHTRSFTEIWIPTRGMGGVTRASREAVLFASRLPQPGGAVRLSLQMNVARAFPGASVTVSHGDAVDFRQAADLNPATMFELQTPPLAAAPQYRIELKDAAGQVLLSHTENTYDALKPSEVAIGKPYPKPVRNGAEEKILGEGEADELMRLLDQAAAAYEKAIEHTPKSAALRKAAGRVSLTLGRFAEAAALLEPVLQAQPADAESAYSLGVARSRLGDDNAAGRLWNAAAHDPAFGAAARFELACAAARGGDAKSAATLFRELAQEGVERAAALEVALERHLQQRADAERAFQTYIEAYPANTLLRAEGVLLGRADEGLWTLLAADPEWILDLADDYFSVGLWEDAAGLLGRSYPDVPELQKEPGQPPPARYPLIAYYRGFARLKAGQSPDTDFRAASAQSTRYVFPSRFSSFAVLRAAIERNPGDTTAHYLLGCLLLNSRMSDEALSEWQLARPAADSIPGYYQTVAHALYNVKNSRHAAETFLEEALAKHPSDADLNKLLQSVRGSASTNSFAPPPPPSYPSALAAAEAALELGAGGRTFEASAIFVARNFPDEKQPPEVRQAYIEVQLRRMLDNVKAGNCQAARAQYIAFGSEDKSLPFTFSSFGALTKSLRIQFYLNMVQAACGDPKTASRAWARIARATPSMGSADFPFPAVAAALLDPAGSARVIETALEKVQNAGDNVDKGLLLYSQGMLLRAAGRNDQANRAFEEGRDKGSGLARFVNGSALYDPPLRPSR